GTLSGAAVGDCGLDTDRDGRVNGLTESEAGPCPTSVCPAPSATPDKNPDDFKRIVVLVRWNRGPGTKYVLQDTTIPYPGVTAAPNVTAITSLPDNSAPVTSGNQITFTATTSKPATTLSWYVDGSPMDPPATSLTATKWQFVWDLKAVGSSTPNAGQVLDGDYLVQARAFDKFGQYGVTRPYGISLNRRIPYAVNGFRAVQVGDNVEMAWGLSPERDIVAYQVSRSNLSAPICAPALVTSCKDFSPPSTQDLVYWANAMDRDPATSTRRIGDDSQKVTIPRPNLSPGAPSGLTGAPAGGNALKLTWVAPSSGDPDGTVAGYAIFRDGNSIGDWYATVDAPTTTWTDPNGLGHTYWVAAIDNKNAQSLKSNGYAG
ncbi:MAG TPA: hypothetical protein VLB47_07000, partial [Solirubrobacteraceae bacterium]|nr:hypothetical protein [Solirubrobacteraceae bacterium]